MEFGLAMTSGTSLFEKTRKTFLFSLLAFFMLWLLLAATFFSLSLCYVYTAPALVEIHQPSWI